MAGIQLTGLASGMDWKTTVEQLMRIERIPQDALKAKKAAQADKQAALDKIKASVSSLKTAAAALNMAASSSTRSAKMISSSSGGVALANPGSVSTTDGAVAGTYDVVVSQVATPSILEGEVGKLRNAATELVLSDYGVTEGSTVTIDGQQLVIDAADLQLTVEQFLTGELGVPPSYDYTQGNLEFAVTPPLGSAGDRGNVLGLLGLKESAGICSQTIPNAALAALNAKLAATSLSDYGLSGSQTTQINGVTISVASGSTLGTLASAINSSAAGVTAYIDASKRRLVITSTEPTTSPVSIESTDPVMQALLGNPIPNSTPGAGAEYSVSRNGRVVGSSTASLNSVDLSAHGLGATTLKFSQAGTYKFEVVGATQTREKIDTFIKAYNDLRTVAGDLTKTTIASDGKVTASVLSGNRDVQNLLSSIRSRIFSPVKDPGGIYADIADDDGSGNYSGLGLDSIGIGFNRDGVLSVSSESKLTTALSQTPSKVNALFSSGASSILGTGSAGSNVLSVSTTSNLLAGQVVSGTGIPSGTTIQSIGTGVITLTNALTSSISSSNVFLPVANQGVAIRLGGLLSLSLSSTTSEPGLFKTASSAVTSETTSIQKQIDAMERRILARQKQLEASFIAMERAQSRSQSQLSQLSNAFTNTK